MAAGELFLNFNMLRLVLGLTKISHWLTYSSVVFIGEHLFENLIQLTGAYQACSALLDGVFYMFGGLTTATFLNGLVQFDGLYGQISKLTNCATLERIGDMNFHSEGCTCRTFGNVILICFDFKNPSTCHSFDGKNFVRRVFELKLLDP